MLKKHFQKKPGSGKPVVELLKNVRESVIMPVFDSLLTKLSQVTNNQTNKQRNKIDKHKKMTFDLSTYASGKSLIMFNSLMSIIFKGIQL